MDTALWSSGHRHLGQRFSVFVCPIPAIDQGLGHSGHNDHSLPSRGKRDGGKISPSSQRVTNRSRQRRAGPLVLEAPDGNAGHQNHRQARHRSLALGPRLRRGTRGPRRDTAKGSFNGCWTRSSTRDNPRQPQARSCSLTTDRNICPPTTISPHARGLTNMRIRIRQTRWRPVISRIPVHRAIQSD